MGFLPSTIHGVWPCPASDQQHCWAAVISEIAKWASNFVQTNSYQKKSITVFSYSQLLNFGLNIIWTSRIFLSFLFPPQGSLCKFHLLLLDG